MEADWVAASVRARALARNRVGASAARQVAAEPDLPGALARLASSVHGDRLAGARSLPAAQRATRQMVLWQLRVVAGWLPARGTGLLRAVAAGYERDNVLALVRQLEGHDVPEPFELGALATAWPRLRTASTAEELGAALRRSPWGEVGAGGTQTLADVLTGVWARAVAASAPEARDWATRTVALVAARIVLHDRAEPSARVREVLRPLLGRGWAEARDLAGLRAALPPSVRGLLDVGSPDELWRAEAAHHALTGTEGAELLRSPRPGPRVVLGAVAVLAADSWRVRAGLAAAAAGGGGSEVLDAVA